MKWFESAAAAGPAEAVAYCGYIYQSGWHGVERDPDKALTSYQTAAGKGDRFGQFLYGQRLLEDGQRKAGIKWIQQAAEQGLLAAQLALAELAGNNTVEAVNWYRRAAEQECPTAMNNLAYLWAEQGKELDKALALAGKTVSLEPENGAFVDTLGWTLFKKGRYAEALGRLQHAAELDREDPNISDHLGETLLKLGRREEAVHWWQRALEQSKDSEFKIKIQQKLQAAK